MNKIKTVSTVSQNETIDASTGEVYQSEKKIVADVQGSKLRSMLSSLKNN
jgi:hypothetical protein